MIADRLLKHTVASKARKPILMAVVLALTLCIRYCPDFIKSTSVFTYLVSPLLWCFVIFIVLCLPRPRPVGKIREKSFLLWITAVCSVLYVLIMMISGVVFGFGKSPFDHSLSGIALNILKIFSVLIATELVRDYLVNGNNGNAKFGDCIFVAVFIYLLSFNPNQFVNLETNLQIIQFIGVDLLAKLCGSFFATYLVYIGGPALSILYLGIHNGFFWFCPILPNLDWIAQAFIEILFPAFCMMLLRYFHNKKIKAYPVRTKEAENPFSWIVVTILSILVIWFSIGVFPIRPFVIVTGSMEPVIYPGDLVVVKRDIEDMKVGDIVQYKSGDIYIFHRIIEILEENEKVLYITKGDNNSLQDPKPVGIEDIKGRVMFIIPKIGYPALLFR